MGTGVPTSGRRFGVVGALAAGPYMRLLRLARGMIHGGIVGDQARVQLTEGGTQGVESDDE